MLMTRVFRAPGRVNLIGEHTDYNGGLVLPAAIDRETQVTVAAIANQSIELTSGNVPELFTFDPNDVDAVPRGAWTDYPQGVAIALRRRGIELPGAALMIESDVPLGAGLSSSAALEVATAYALLSLTERALDPLEIALICQEAEQEFVGVRCGIMDQYTAVNAREDHALLLDCRTMVADHVPLPSSLRLAVCNTMVKHSLAAGAYNERRQECELAARTLGVEFLTDLSVAESSGRLDLLPETLQRRAQHVISENERVREAAACLAVEDLGALGKLLEESHCSLRDDFEVSCPELDLMVEIARNQAGVYGARMTGAGFGGCTINLVEAGAAEAFRSRMVEKYFRETKMVPEIYLCSTADGASRH